jgi:hypothetical protein
MLRVHETDDNWVPKVHPLDRQVEAEDPLELLADVVPGDPEVMLECILQEFVWMGWDADQLYSLFRNPGYPLLCELRQYYGDEEVERRIAELLARSGQFRFHETLVEPEGDEHIEDGENFELVPLTLSPALWDELSEPTGDKDLSLPTEGISHGPSL